MNDCVNGDMRDRLPDLVNGILSRDEQLAVESHLSVCADCAAEVELLQTARAALRFAPPMNVTRIASAVQSTGAERMAARRAWPSPVRLAAMAAAAAIVATIVFSRDDTSRAVPAVTVTAEDQRNNDSAAGNAVAVVPAVVDQPRPEPAPPVSSPSTTTLALGTDVSDLEEEQLVALLESVSELDALPSEEPLSVEVEAINMESQK